MRHFEDFQTGETFMCGPRLVTRDEIVAFAAEFDPQPFHLDEEAARATALGGLAASGFHSCCVMMRMITDELLAGTAFLGAPGVEEVRWLMPLRPGTRVRIRGTVADTKTSRSRGDMGFVTFVHEMIDESDAVLMTLRVNAMFSRRQPAGAAEDAAS